MERGFIGDSKVFLRQNLDMGVISDFQYMVYNRMMHNMLSSLDFCIKGYIYLDESPETCYHRVQQRGREAESGMTLELLTRLNNYYMELIESLPHVLRSSDLNEIVNHVKSID